MKDRLLNALRGGRRSTNAIGRIQITRGGRGFLIPEDSTLPEIAISARDTGNAFHDDRVVVSTGGDSSPRVIEILERRRTRFVGTLRRADGRLQVSADDPRVSRVFEIRQTKGRGRPPRVGEKVIVELTRWNPGRGNPEGRIVETLGAPGTEGVDMLGVLRHYQLDAAFPAEVIREAKSFGNRVRAEDLRDRRDCREHSVITIDPDDAKDFDDAICLESAGRGRWRLWVHIADVSHYVRPGSALDEEAKRRGNSTYLVDRVVPMLPEELSNELCSLKPSVDRLTKCVEFLLSDDGKVLKTDFYPAVIHSRRRYTYAEAMAALDRPPADAIETMLHAAGRLAMAVRARRFRAGSLDLDFPETKIRLDDRGRIARIERMESDLSHQLIEEFMLLANEAVAERLMKTKRPALYRAHEAPDPDRLQGYRDEVLSHQIPCGNLSRPQEVRKLLGLLGELAVGPALKIGFLKSLNRARYAAEPLGHYGLAKKKYTHFTSPIRRYADLVVHRSLFGARERDRHGALSRVADHLSATERNSADAERDSKEVKLHAHLLEQIRVGKRERFPARVTRLSDFGFFVDVDALGMGGLVPLTLLDDDHYRHEARGNRVVGQRRGRVFRLGDVIEVEVAKVDTDRRIVDFRPASRPPSRRKRSRGRRRTAAVA